MPSKVRYLLVAVLACSSPPAPGCDLGHCEVPDAGSGAVDAGGDVAVDFCAGARVLTTAPLVANTTTGSSRYTTECGGDGNDLLFRVTLTQPQDVMFIASPLDIGWPIVALFEKPCTPGALVTLACGEGTAGAYNLPPGEYYALLDSPSGAEGPSELNLVLSPPAPPPANDRCAEAEALVFTDGRASVKGDTRTSADDSLADGGSSSCSPSTRHDGKDVVYRYTLSQPRTVTVSVTAHGTFRPVVYVTASCAGSELACGASPSSGPVSLVFPNQPAGTYLVWVDGAASGLGAAGAFTLEVQQK